MALRVLPAVVGGALFPHSLCCAVVQCAVVRFVRTVDDSLRDSCGIWCYFIFGIVLRTYGRSFFAV